MSMEVPSVSKLKLCQKLYELNSWIIPVINRFPVSCRFSLGNKIFQLSFELLELTLQANQTLGKSRLVLQNKISWKLDSLRMAIRLAKDLRIISYKQYGQAASRLDEIYRMLNSWRKAKLTGAKDTLSNQE